MKNQLFQNNEKLPLPEFVTNPKTASQIAMKNAWLKKNAVQLLPEVTIKAPKFSDSDNTDYDEGLLEGSKDSWEMSKSSKSNSLPYMSGKLEGFKKKIGNPNLIKDPKQKAKAIERLNSLSNKLDDKEVTIKGFKKGGKLSSFNKIKF